MPVRVWLVVAALFALLSAPAMAAPQDAVLNKEGYWGIDIDGGACVASMTLQGGAVFLLRAADGQVTFGLFGRAPLPRGKAGRIETEAYGVDFRPSYGEDDTTLYYDGQLDARALAALRLARQVRILVDGRMAAAMTFEGTGFEGALDGVVACSQGEAGWWGEGVGQVQAAGPERAMNPEGIWSLAADGDTCASGARIDESGGLVLIALNGGRDIVMGFGRDGGFKRGRKGVFATDAYSFAFKPLYDGDDYMQLDEVFDSQGLFALRRAKSIRVTVDGREVVSAEVADTGLPALLTALADCGAGRSGWWGDGAKQP